MMMHTGTLRCAQRDMGDKVTFALLRKKLYTASATFAWKIRRRSRRVR